VSTTGKHQFEVDLDSSTPFGLRSTQLDTSPHIAGHLCFITSGISVFALDATSGRRRWRYDLNSSIDGLVVLGNTVYLSATTDSGPALVAIDTTSGRKRWQYPNRLVPLTADADHLIVAEAASGRLRGIDPATGELLWRSDRRVQAPTLNPGSVAIADGTLWHLQAGRLTALTASTADQHWTVSLEGDGSTWGDRFAVADTIYVLEPDSERLTAVGMDGEPRWSRELRDAATGIAVGTETIYAATRTGIEAVAVSDGERRFRVAPAERPGHALTPLVSDGAVYGVAGGTLFGVSDA
jgi:outer membrane protein assembly factor BamB